jgi:ribosomal protein S18 acetylase RimI-like enzyme
MNVRELKEPFDFDAILYIENICFGESEAFTKAELPQIIQDCPIRIGAYAGVKLIGYALARYSFSLGYLYSSAVLPEYRLLGLGELMLCERLKHLVELDCIVIQAHTKTTNVASASLLNKHNFYVKDYLPDYYADNEDGILWEKRTI